MNCFTERVWLFSTRLQNAETFDMRLLFSVESMSCMQAIVSSNFLPERIAGHLAGGPGAAGPGDRCGAASACNPSGAVDRGGSVTGVLDM